MQICEFERNVLRRIDRGDLPDDPGAAWWAACEALAGRGMLAAGVITAAGREALAPRRVQMSRRKGGWRKDHPDAVVVARPSKWGNPFAVGDPGVPDRATAVECFEGLHGLIPDLDQLVGRDLACWCPLDQPCHADVLLEWANSDEVGV